MSTPTPALVFEPDGYDLQGPRLMGRQSAGNAFLRAVVQGRGDASLTAVTPHRRSAEVFAHMVRSMDPQAPVQWAPPDRLDLLAASGLLYLPGPGLGDAARLRLRAGPQAYSLSGVTHTTASHGAMDAIRALTTAPVMPWDALVCTSRAVLSTVQRVLDQEIDFLQWRLGCTRKPTLPALPVIPLGVHADDFAPSTARRQDARRALAVAEDEVVMLFVGRLSFHSKAHPHPMYAAAQAVARQTGRRIVLLQCGWFANESIEAAFRQAAEQTCPNVRCLFTDGQDADVRARAWAAADVFISLSDNIQETFGLTPIEAMAAGLPVVVTDWDGYKDTVEHGVHGFRVPTWMPGPGPGQAWALAHEAGTLNYDRYCGLACQTVSVDMDALVTCLRDLVEQPALRRRLGDAAQAHVRAQLDWTVVYRRYQSLWVELDALRRDATVVRSAVSADPARGVPRVDAARLDPGVSFQGYGTHEIGPATRVTVREGWTWSALRAVLQAPLFSYAITGEAAWAQHERLWSRLGQCPQSSAEVADLVGPEPEAARERAVAVIAQWAKAGAVSLQPPVAAPAP